MKKVLLFFAAAAALVLAASCNKGGDSTVLLPPAQFTDKAQKLLLDESSTANPGFIAIELSEGGRYLVSRRVIKSEAVVEYLRGTYTVSNNVYTLAGFGTLTIIDGQVTIQANGEDYVIPCSKAPKFPANNFYTTLARSWKVDKTDISVSFDGKSSVGVVKDGCDIPAILKELEDKSGQDLKDETMSGYVVKEINFTMSKTIEIAFTARHSVVANNVSLTEDGSVSYVLSGASDVEVLSGQATGKIDLNPGLGSNQIKLTLDAEVNSNGGKTYKGKVSFILSPAA